MKFKFLNIFLLLAISSNILSSEERKENDVPHRGFGRDYFPYGPFGMGFPPGAYNDPNVKQDTSYLTVAKLAWKQGLKQGLQQSSYDLVLNLVKFIPNDVSHLGALFLNRMHKFAYKCNKLQDNIVYWNGMLDIWISDFSDSTNLDLLNKKRRAKLISGDSAEPAQQTDLDKLSWETDQKQAQITLNFIDQELEKSLALFDSNKLDYSDVYFGLLRRSVASLMNSFSIQYNSGLIILIKQAQSYISELLEYIKAAKSYDELQKFNEDSKVSRCINKIKLSLEQLYQRLTSNELTTKSSSNKLKTFKSINPALLGLGN